MDVTEVNGDEYVLVTVLRLDEESTFRSAEDHHWSLVYGEGQDF